MGNVTSTILCAVGSGATRMGNFTVATSEAASLYRCKSTVNYTGINDQFVLDPAATDSSHTTLQRKHILFHYQQHEFHHAPTPYKNNNNHVGMVVTHRY